MSLHCEAGAVEAQISARLGDGLRWEARGREGGARRVWRVEGPKGALIVLELGSERVWRRALKGMVAMGPPLRAAKVGVPRVLAADREAARLLVTEIPGRRLEGWGDLRWFRLAGEAVAKAGAAPLWDVPTVTLDEAIRRRAARWVEAGRGVVSTEILRLVRRKVGEAEPFAGVRRVWAHRRCGPRSWRVGPEGLGWIGFHRSGPDAPEMDLVEVLLCAPPVAARAFLQGWGGRLQGAARARVEVLAALVALRAVVRGAEGGPQNEQGSAFALLQRLGDEDPLGLDRL